jgi:tape measure domain-containing protein
MPEDIIEELRKRDHQVIETEDMEHGLEANDIVYLTRIQEELFAVAQRTRTEYAGVADLYVKLAQTSDDLGASQADLLKFTEAVGNALTVSGTSAQQAQGALLQLSQGLASGVFRAEEFNSVLEGAPEIIRTVAKNLEGMGGSIGKLRTAVKDGQVTSEAFFRAFLAGSADLAKRAESLPLTFGALVVLGGADMVSVVIRMSLVQLETPDPMRGRVGAVNSVFVGASNQIGEFESGVLGRLARAGARGGGGWRGDHDRRRAVDAMVPGAGAPRPACRGRPAGRGRAPATLRLTRRAGGHAGHVRCSPAAQGAARAARRDEMHGVPPAAAG